MGSSSSLHHICLFLFPGLSIGAIFDSSLPNPQDEPPVVYQIPKMNPQVDYLPHTLSD
ncbi:hypothetical protein YC2023_105909 [Brassica napus]